MDRIKEIYEELQETYPSSVRATLLELAVSIYNTEVLAKAIRAGSYKSSRYDGGPG